MKTHDRHVLSESIWLEISGILFSSIPSELIQEGPDFRAEIITDLTSLEYFHRNHVFDGLTPTYILTDGQGLKIYGTYSVLPTCQEFSLEIILQRPIFNSIESLSEKKLAKASVEEFSVNTMTFKSKLLLCGK